MFTVTVKAKEVATTAAPATTQASADATTQAPQQDSSADASGDSLKKVELSSTSPKVGETITAVLTPSSAKDVSSYTWFLDGKEVSGNATSSYVVKSEDIGKTLKVVVTTTKGDKIESNTSAAIIEDKTTKVEVVDRSGFQADGSALLGDILDLEFGSALGIPQQITWYVNNTLAGTYNSTGGQLTATAYNTATKGLTGQCYAVIKSESGSTYTSNTVNIVGTPVPAKVTEFAITEDYTSNANIDIAKTSSKSVLTFKLNRDYDGVVYLVKAADDVTTTKGLKVATASSNGEKYNVARIPSVDKVTDLTESNVLKAGYGLKYVNTNTHEVTYMVKSPTVDRGTSYVLAFDQDEFAADNIGTSVNKSANVTTAVTAPYVKAPTKIAITALNVITTAGATKATLYYGASSDAVCEYLGNAFAGTAETALIEYYADNNYDVKEGTKFNVGASAITKGVEAGTIAAASDTDIVSVYATFTGGAGIFGKEKVSLTSAYREVPSTEPGTVSVAGVKGSADAVKVTIAGQKVDGTVYLLGKQPFCNEKGVALGNPVNPTTGAASANGTNVGLGQPQKAATSVAITEAYMISKFNPSDQNTYVSKADVPKTAGSYTFEKVITKIENTKDPVVGDMWVAVFVPNGEMFKVANSTGRSFNLGAYCYKYKNASNVVVSGNSISKLVGLDQFGTELAPSTNQMTGEFTLTNESNTKNDTIAISVANDGTVTFAGASGTPIPDDVYSYTNPVSKQKISVTMTAGAEGKLTIS